MQYDRGMDEATARALDAAGRKLRKARAEMEEATTWARGAIARALAENVPIAEIERRTGYHRNSIRAMRRREDTSGPHL